MQYSKRDKGIAWLLVATQVALIAIMVAFPRDAGWVPTGYMRAFGSLLMAAGVLAGLWSFVYLGRGLTPLPLPNGSATLVTRGPYRFVRHPIYTSVLVLMTGIMVKAGSVIVLASLVGLFVLFGVKSRWEETHLSNAFPTYEQYTRNTGRFLPRLGR